MPSVLLLIRRRRVAAGSGLSTDLGTTTKYVRRAASGAAGNGLGTTIKLDPATHKERRRGQRPGHHNQVPETNNCRLICQMFFSCCDSAAWPQAAVWASAWAPRSLTCDRSYVQRLKNSTSSKVHRRDCYLASVHMKLVIFTLLLCSSAVCSSLDATASRCHRQRSKHRPEHHD
jgi:hypothetical protein